MSIKKKGNIVRVSKTDAKGNKKVVYYTTQEQEYKGQKTYSVWECDKSGKPTKDYPLISMGKNKAEIVFAFADEFNNFLKDAE